MTSFVKVMATVVLLAAYARAAAPVNCKSPDGTYDLTGLSGADIMSKDTAYNYAINVCGQAAKPSTCPTTLAAGSVYQWPLQGTGTCHMLSSWDTTATYTPISNTDPSQGVLVSIKNGDKCADFRQVIFAFVCASGSSTTYTLKQPDPNVCTYSVAMANSFGCPAGSGGGGGGGSKGLSGGSVFLIIFFVGFFVYVLAGCIYKRTKVGASGMEACPNIDFWRDLPSLIKDGFRFTWHKLRSCCGGGDASYEGIK